MSRKKKNKKTRSEKRDEFRTYKNEPHPKYVYERKGDDLNYLSMTHKPPKPLEKDYVKLERSADPNDKRTAYISIKSEKDNMRNFGARKKNWSFSDKDKKTVKRIIKQNKKGK